MSDYFDASSNRIGKGVLARSSQVNDLRDSVGAGFDLLPTPDELNTGLVTFGTDTGSANAYAVAMPTTLTEYVTGMIVEFLPANSNTAASTMDVDGIGPIPIKRPDGSDLEANDIYVGNPYALRYNGTEFRFVTSFPLSSVISASELAQAVIDAEASETAAGISEVNAAASAAEAAVSASQFTDAWLIKTTTYQAVVGDKIMADTDTTGAFTVTLPATPDEGDWIYISDYAGTFSVANLTLGRNGENIYGQAEDLILDINNFVSRLEYVDSTQGWRFV